MPGEQRQKKRWWGKTREVNNTNTKQTLVGCEDKCHLYPKSNRNLCIFRDVT